MRIDAAKCVACAPNQVSDENGICQDCSGTIVGNTCLTCPSDIEIDGTTSAFLGRWETSASNLGLDPCPGWFYLQVDHPDAFFSRGAARLSTIIELDAATQSTCAQSYELQYQDEPPGTSTTVTEQTLLQAGTWEGTGTFVPCSGLPQINIAALSQLKYGSAPIRFGTKVVAGVAVSFDAYLTSPPTQ